MKLTPSKALKEIGLLRENGCYIKSTVEYKIVEKALKDSEKTDKYYAKLLESVLNDKEHKALEIIKTINKSNNHIRLIQRNNFGEDEIAYYLVISNCEYRLRNKEQFDLLKEVLGK